MAELKEITSNIESQNATIDLSGEDKLYLVAGGVLYQVEFPRFGRMEATVVDGEIVGFDFSIKARVPNRQERKRNK
ncbi:hypothetical protein [Aneurinibacillus terranovensis]|uniref:hypothetical protein n=1 Tax=Aneurinibacillus terranovensis TaxID=278991 RepID=UPI00041DC1F6|nr:hypothetical protein [Aneurinibacillus terranovensis]